MTMPSRTTCRSAGLSLMRVGAGCGSGAQGASKRSRRACTRCGRRNRPSSASAPVPRTICSGVTFQSPWPMLMFTVSPGYQRSLRFFSFQAGLGRIPVFSPDRSMPLGWPKP